MANPTAAMLVIGDEILSGRTRDANMHLLAQRLTNAGIELKEAAVVSDAPAAIVASVNRLRAGHDYVITSGGIGPTHDDITAENIAAAFGVPIDVRDDARAILQQHYEANGIELNDARLRMARIPDGAELIANPISAAPGFRIENVFVLAGVPKIFEAMLAEILPGLAKGERIHSKTICVELGEGDIAGPLGAIAARFPDLSVGSYPFQEDGRFGSNLVLRGRDSSRIESAELALREAFGAHAK